MANIQGIRIGLTVAAFVVALLTVNTLSAAAGVQVSLSSGGLPAAEEISETGGQFQSPNVTGVGSEDPGFFGVAVGVTKTVQQLIGFTTNLNGMLSSYGVPSVIGYSVQVMVDLVMGLGVLQILLRFKL